MAPVWRSAAPPSRAELRDHLLASRIAGAVGTPRESNLRNISFAARRDPLYTFGLTWGDRWGVGEILALMADRCGISPEPGYLMGPDTIDVERTLDALEAIADRVAGAARDGERVMLATGHPAGLLPLYLALADGLAAAGATVLRAGAGLGYDSTAPSIRQRRRQIRYVGGVATVSNHGELNHTHSPRPMELVLEALRDAGEPFPDLVIGDHGWAGAAGEAGIEAVSFADSNDPALFVGQAEGKVATVVPLDDNVLPHLYEPVAAALLDRAGLKSHL